MAFSDYRITENCLEGVLKRHEDRGANYSNNHPTWQTRPWLVRNSYWVLGKVTRQDRSAFKTIKTDFGIVAISHNNELLTSKI